MKYFLVCALVILLSSVLADQPLVLSPRHVQGTGPVGTDDTVYSQTYNYGILLSGISIYSAGDRWACDDFVLDDDYYVTDIYIWMIWTGVPASMMNLVISEDDANDSDPNTNTDVWVESVPCTSTFTGDSNWGYDIYETHCIIDPGLYPELDEGIHYYFEVQADVVDNCFILVSDNYIGDYLWYDDGSGVWVRSDVIFGAPMDLFFDFYGEPMSALESETWGSIKAFF